MDLEDIESKCLSSGVFNVVQSTDYESANRHRNEQLDCAQLWKTRPFKRESEFLQGAGCRERRSPRKKAKATRASALMIDELKNGFPSPTFRSDYAPRTRTRRDWRPEFLMRHLRGGDRRCGCNEEYAMVQRDGSRSASFVAEAPKIYSIALRSGARSAIDVDDPRADSCAVTRDCKKCSSIVRRAMIVCKYWIAQTTAASNLPTVVAAKERANYRTTVLDRTESTDLPRLDRKRNYSRDDRSCERAEEWQRKKNNDTAIVALQDDRAAGDRSFTLDLADLPARKDHKQLASGSGVTKKDAQIQTSGRKRSRRRRRKSWCKSTNERIADDRPIRDSDGMYRGDKSRSSVRALESKRAEYVKKFTAVNRRIEEITAALRETCYGDGSPRNNVENRERRYFSSTRDDARTMERESNDVDDNYAIREGNSVPVNVKRTVGETQNDRLRKSVRKILRASNRLNNDTALSFGRENPKGVIVTSTKPDDNLNANDTYMRDSVRAFATKETFRSLEQTAGNRKGTKCRVLEQISVDLNSTRHDGEIQESSIDNEFFDEVRPRDNFALTNGDEHTRISIGDFVDLERPRGCKEVVEGKVEGELSILEDIKRRIDKDFDGPSTRSEDDAEDFLAVSGSFNFGNDDRSCRPAATFEESTSASLIVHDSSYFDTSEIQICDSTSTDAVSERSNRTSTLSKYYSCTQFPSLISLREDEDELVHEVEDQSATIHPDSYSDLRSNTVYYDLNTSSYVERSHSDVSLNRNNSQLNLGSRFDQSRVNLGYFARHLRSDKLLAGTINERNDMSESPNAVQEAKNQVGEDECPLGESDKRTKESRVNFEKCCAADCTLETSKSSRYIGSIDSGVFLSSSLIDLCPHDTSFDGDVKPPQRRRKQRRAKRHDESPPTFDFSSDSSCNDDAHDRRVDDVVRDLTKNLILCERRAKTKLREMRQALLRARDTHRPRHTSSSRARKSSKNLDAYYGFFSSPRWRNEDERIVSLSTPSLLSLSSSEVEECESVCQLNSRSDFCKSVVAS